MSAPVISTTVDAQSSINQVHVIGAGPVGLLLAALLQEVDGLDVSLYEKRNEYTRTRMVQLAPYLLADSVEAYCTDAIDTDGIEAVFDRQELADGIAFRQAISPDLMAMLRAWSLGFCPLNAIERSVSDLIDSRTSNPVRRTSGVITPDDVIAMLDPDSIVIDCTGSKSLLRDQLTTTPDDGPEANTMKVRLEYALVITFLYGQPYDCNEYCKYYKNIENPHYKFIPMVNRTHYDGSVSHVTGIVNISADEYAAMPPRFDGEWLRGNFPDVVHSMDRFIDKVRQETAGEVIGDLEIVRIPLDLYRARNATNRQWLTSGRDDSPLARSPVFLAGDSAIGSPYFQSISLGFECAAHLAGLLTQPGLPLREKLDRYELYMYKQWLRVYMRSKMIKHNKDVFESIDDPFALLEKLHIY
jgi:2-polyprenyl-6-methoxyphenol hydroxylase-like FAD-dependent oxidoreductase